MANVNVTYQEMEAQADKLVSAQQEIDSYLRNLKSQVDGLVSGGFVTDAASGAFQGSYEEFTTGAQKTIEGLHGMAQYLKKAAQTFRDVDSQLSSALKG
ncbi:hypothetical protein GCM10022215_07450 [Nocardioides fonticola]|uniref:ESAT-6-like protein n=1 Tax=Nocardioides fonticola TaxID=450363 RepID=A0ABP7XEX8_9ACTN